jgi:hypothetical protein
MDRQRRTRRGYAHQQRQCSTGGTAALLTAQPSYDIGACQVPATNEFGGAESPENRAAAEERKWRPQLQALAAEVRAEFDADLLERIRSVWRQVPKHRRAPGSVTTA